jgi:hypothetical protein
VLVETAQLSSRASTAASPTLLASCTRTKYFICPFRLDTLQFPVLETFPLVLLCKECSREGINVSVTLPRHQQKNVLNFFIFMLHMTSFLKVVNICAPVHEFFFIQSSEFRTLQQKKLTRVQIHLARGGAAEKCFISLKMFLNCRRRRRVEKFSPGKTFLPLRAGMANIFAACAEKTLREEKLRIDPEKPVKDNGLMGEKSRLKHYICKDC